jgi:HK97 gp10 family phage protein
VTPLDKSISRVFDDLKKLESSLAKKIIKKGQRAGAKLLAAEMRKNVPVKSGALKKTIKVRAGKRSKNKTSIQVSIGDNEAYYPGFVEFGKKNVPPNPFMKRSSDAVKDQVREAVANAIDVEIKNGSWTRSVK